MILAILISAVVVGLCSAIPYVTLKQVSDVIASGPANARGCHLSMTIASITMAHVVKALSIPSLLSGLCRDCRSAT